MSTITSKVFAPRSDCAACRNVQQATDGNGKAKPIKPGLSRNNVGITVPKQLKEIAKKHSQTNLPLTVTAALVDHAAIWTIGTSHILLTAYSPTAGAMTFLPAAIAIARFQRALENLTHEGMHFNWIRKPKWLNDLLTNLLAARPAFSDVGASRPGHRNHHDKFDQEGTDPDHDRHVELDFRSLDRSNPWRFARGIAGRMCTYWGGWFAAIGSSPTVLMDSLFWMIVFIGLPAYLVMGWWAIAIVFAYWLFPLLVVLPVHRCIAEAAKHKYEKAATVYGNTYSNIGLIHRVWLHPHSDGFHLQHHLFESVPWFRLAACHRELCQVDPNGYGKGHVRLNVLEQ